MLYQNLKYINGLYVDDEIKIIDIIITNSENISIEILYFKLFFSTNINLNVESEAKIPIINIINILLSRKYHIP